LQFGNEPMNAREAIARTRSALEDSIRRHFVSDVPVGIFLSGGLDSAAIVALARSCGFGRLKTLCISFDDPAYNEGQSAAETAEHFGTEHHDWRMTASEGRRLLSEFIKNIDRPSVDGFNTYCVAKFAHDQGLKVVLSGVGGDELFGSYASFRIIPKLMAWHRRLGLVKPVRGFAGRLGERLANQQRIRRLSTFLRTPGHLADAYWTTRGSFSPCEAKQLMELLLGDRFDFEALDVPELAAPDQPTIADEISYLEMTRYMRNQLLRDSDVMSMAWGLELRTPLVDRKLIDRVGRVPAEQRLAAGKQLLINAVPEIPKFIAQRTKRGFRFPFDQWVREEWSDLFKEIDRIMPPRTMTWYRHWSLFMVTHFLRTNGFPCQLEVEPHSSRNFERRPHSRKGAAVP
jgi:asparagine synthase (glutamine-hydrolysing)